jgi:hypothetical protein
VGALPGCGFQHGAAGMTLDPVILSRIQFGFRGRMTDRF